MSKARKKTDVPVTFEAAMEQLEYSVSRLESGELTLEASLEVFEQGIAASRTCTCLLDETRKRVQALVESAGGDLELEFLDQDTGTAGDDDPGSGLT